MTQVADLVQIRKLTPGRAAFAARLVRDLVHDGGEQEIAAEANQLITSAHAALTKRRAWAKGRAAASAARAGGKAVELDNQIDRLVSAIYNNAQSFLRSMNEKEPEAVKAQELVSELFPRGAIDITHRAFEDEAAAVNLLVKDLQGRLASHAETLGLTPLVRQLASANATFTDALGQTPAGTVSYDVVTAAENDTQELLAGLVISIMSKYRGTEEAAVTRRSQLLAPILEQDARVADALRRRRPVADVDPDTGREVDPTPVAA
jgi:hypothetical protein